MMRRYLSALLVFLLLPVTLAAAPVMRAPSLGVDLNPSALSPNGDGVADSVELTISHPAVTLAVTVSDPGDNTIRSLMGPTPVDDTPTTLSWDGTDGLGSVVSDGLYAIHVVAEDGTGTTVLDRPIPVDTRDPRVRWAGIVPEPLVSDRRISFRFRVSDATPTRIEIEIADSGLDPIAQVTGRPGARVVRWHPRSGMLPGLYFARPTAVDAAGNSARGKWKAFRDHRPADTRVFHRLGGTGRLVALTFDDCNDGGAWGRILRTLDARNAHASFFCLGPNVSRFKAQARKTVVDGHTIGSHSMNHALETKLSYQEILRQNRAPQGVWWKVARVTPAPYFRPPYGAYDSEVLRAVGDAGYARTIIWDVDPRDWEHPGAAVIANRVVANSHPGSIVVMHALDGTAAALPSIIRRLRARGLQPVSLRDLFQATGMRAPEDAGPVLADPFE